MASSPFLLDCPHCARHVRVGSSACPFCEGALPASFGKGIVPRSKRPTRRNETLVYLAGTSALALAACGGIVNVVGDDASSVDATMDGASTDGMSADGTPIDSTAMDQQVAVPYGVPPPFDAGRDVRDAEVIRDAGCPDACPTMCCHTPDAAPLCCHVVPPYGLPPDPPDPPK
jgi:hypothetical protein